MCRPLHIVEQRQGDQQLYADTDCSPENLLEAMDDRKGRRERVRDIRAHGATWWWWWWCTWMGSRENLDKIGARAHRQTHTHTHNTHTYIYIYIYIRDDSVDRAFGAQPKELFSQVYQFSSYKNSLRASHLSLSLVGLKVLTRTIMNNHLTHQLSQWES